MLLCSEIADSMQRTIGREREEVVERRSRLTVCAFALSHRAHVTVIAMPSVSRLLSRCFLLAARCSLLVAVACCLYPPPLPSSSSALFPRPATVCPWLCPLPPFSKSPTPSSNTSHAGDRGYFVSEAIAGI